MLTVRSVLCPVDFSEQSRQALLWAAAIAQRRGAELTVLNERVASGQRMLARLSASFPNAHTECVVSVGRPADTIGALAVEYGAGLVVMGLANADDWERRKPGSIAYRVLRVAHVAVVVVPHPEAQAAADQTANGAELSIGRASRAE